MSDVERSRSKVSLYRAIIIGVFALTLTVVSFHGGLDRFAQREVVDTTNESIGIYVVSRAINALVSVLQTSQLNLPLLASAEVGQMLDPVNDAVERLSSMVVWAVGSLLVQRILLEVVSGPVFNWFLCSIAVGMTAFLLLMEWEGFRIGCRRILVVSDSRIELFRDWLVRVFVIVVIFRFIVPAFIALSFLVGQAFLQSEITKNKEQLSLLRTQVSNIAGSPSADVSNLEKDKAREEARLKAFDESKASLRQQIERLDARIRQINDELGWRRLLPESLGGSRMRKRFER